MPLPSEVAVTGIVPLLWVHDIAGSVAFYVDGLGFEKTDEWIDEGRLRWCRLRRGGASMMLQEFWTEGSHRNVPDGAVGVGVSFYFACDDARRLYEMLRDRRVEVDRPFVGNGQWVTRLTDPDGYELLFQSPADAPEETTYAEPQST